MNKQIADFINPVENNLNEQNVDTSDDIAIDKAGEIRITEKYSDVMTVDSDDLIALEPIQNQLDLGNIIYGFLKATLFYNKVLSFRPSVYIVSQARKMSIV